MPSNVFAKYLLDKLTERNLNADHLAYGLGYGQPHPVQQWLEDSLPPAEMLAPITDQLGLDPLEVSVGWLIAQCPVFESLLQDDVLIPKGCSFPRGL